VGVREVHCIEPVPSPSLAIVRGIQELIDHL
jgi:hypothetical protein